MSIALAGASGSGKTKSALEIAVGLAGPDGRIAVIDTEGRRATHYARKYKFDHVDFKPDYTPERCTQAIAELQQDGYDVVIFDSASDEYEGEGGMIDMAEAEGAWIKTKARHKHNLIRHLRNTAGTVIFCLRAEEKVKVERDQRGKQVYVPQGWMPICEKRFMYDMTLSLTLSPATPGMPRFDLPRKINEDFAGLFKEGQLIDRRVGEQLRAWALDVDAVQATGTTGGQQQQSAADRTKTIVDDLIVRIQASTSVDAVNAIFQEETVQKQVAWLLDKRPDEHARLYAAANAKRAELEKAVA